MNRARGRFARIGNGRGFMPRQMLPLLPITSKTRVRELGARIKMYLDLLFNKQPKHSGDAINLPD